jgi:small subunit ribosomal protein S19e
MATVYDVKASDVIGLAAERLRDKLKKPAYMGFVKSGSGRERMPVDPNFWYIRSASILRQVYMNGPVGVSRLQTKYGKKKEHVIHHKHHVRAGGSIIRDSLIELEKAGLVKNTKAGRVITPQGKSFVDKVCKELSGQSK